MMGYGTIVDAFKSLFPSERDQYAKSLSDDASRATTLEEAGGLKQHIVADNATDDYEKALLTFIVEESGSVPSLLTSLRRSA